MEDARHEEFLKRYIQVQLALRRFVFVHVPDFQEAEDVLQEVSLVLWKKFGEFTGEGSFQAWAFGVARNEVLHACRSWARRRLLLQADMAGVFEDRLLASTPHFDRRQTYLDECLGKLPEKARAVVTARYSSGLTAENLAKSAGSTAEAVRALLYRVRKAIAQCLEKAAGGQAIREGAS